MATSVRKNTLNDASTFYCFSPLVMIITFVLEIGMAVYVGLSSRLKTRVSRIIFSLLVLLGSFQLFEYLLCNQHTQADINFWARMGFIAITFLPVLGLHLTSALVRRAKLPGYVRLGYVFAIAWTAYFLLVQSSIIQGVCAANYAIIDLTHRTRQLYSVYYWGLLIVGMWEAYTLSRRMQFRKYRKSLRYLILGYLVFMVPTIMSIVIYPTTFRAVPSIMCGFAVVLAFILTLYVWPSGEGKEIQD